MKVGDEQMIHEQDRNQISEAEQRARWPLAFNDMRLPLKVGVHLDMNIDRNSNTMDHWTLHPKYLRNILAGMRRIDLDGEVVGDEITEAEKANAFHRLLMVRSDIVSAKGRSGGYGYAIGLSPQDAEAEARRGLPKGSAARMRGEVPKG